MTRVIKGRMPPNKSRVEAAKRLKKIGKRLSSSGRIFTDAGEAVEFLKTTKGNLYIPADHGKTRFLIDASFDLAAHGKKVLMIVPNLIEMKKLKSNLDYSTKNDPEKEKLLRADLHEIQFQLGNLNLQDVLHKKRFFVGTFQNRLFRELFGVFKPMMNPDVVVFTDLNYTRPEHFLRFLVQKHPQIVASYGDKYGSMECSAFSFVTGNEGKLDRLILPKRESATETSEVVTPPKHPRITFP